MSLAKKKHLKKGFSLVEMLITLSLITILSAIIVPKYSFLKTSAKITEAKHGLTKLYRQQKVFYIENGYYTDEDIGFNFKSKSYKIGFDKNSWGANTSQAITNCSVNDNNFKAGSSNDKNELINLTINEKNCLLKIQKGFSDCNRGHGDCLSN